MAVASSSRMASIRHHLDGWGLTHYFKVIVSGEQFSASKPNPEIFLRAAEALGTVPSRTLVLEDSYNGVRAGVAAGYGENAFLCVFLGLLTGVGGGVLRDMMSREIPMVLCRRVYAIASIIGGAAYFLLRTPLQESTAALTGVILVFAIRMLATHYRWSLPRISEDQQTEPKK